MFLSHLDFVAHRGEKNRRLPVYALAAQPQPHARLATGAQDGSIRLWNTRRFTEGEGEGEVDDDNSSLGPRLLATLVMHSGAVMCLNWGVLGRQILASGADDTRVVLWEKDDSVSVSSVSTSASTNSSAGVESWRPVKILFGHESDVADVAWSPDGSYLASCSLDSHIFIWDAFSFEKIKRLDGHQGFVKGITWDPVGKYLASQSDDKTVRVWRTSDWAVEHEISEPFKHASSATFFQRLSWSPDGSCIAAANGENSNIPVTPIINRDNWSSEVSLVGHQAPIEVAVSKIPEPQDDSGSTLNSGRRKVTTSVCAIGGQDRGVSVWWTARPFAAASAVDVFTHTVLDLCWSSDGFTLFACSYDGNVFSFAFDKNEFGLPVPAQVTESSLMKYGYQKVRQGVVESVTQVALEEEFTKRGNGVHSVMRSKSSSIGFVDPQISKPPILSSSLAQKESRTASGKKRITPVLIRSAKSQLNPAVVHIGPTALLNQNLETLNDGNGIETGTGTKRKIAQRTENENVPNQQGAYILPTFASVTLSSRLLAVPALKAKFTTPVSTGQAGTFLNLECTENAGAGSKITGSRNGEIQFNVLISSRVTMVAGAPDFWVATTVDGSLNVFSPAGRRDIKNQKNLLSNEIFTPLARADNPSAVESLKLAGATILPSNGAPLVSLSNGDFFVYHYPLRVWMNVRGFEMAGNGIARVPPVYENRAGFVIPTNSGGIAAKRVAVTGLNANTSSSSLLEYAELGIACSIALGSNPEDYKTWMSLYARKLSDEGSVARVRELCEDLVGDVSDTGIGAEVMGIPKRALLKEVLPILGWVLVLKSTNRDLQRLVGGYREFLETCSGLQ
ncbi:HIR complex subunit [Entophlyctis luteolus]|nr:HIR complex subunit [Entophlyctis luteolus]